jgi:hypothetical protein
VPVISGQLIKEGNEYLENNQIELAKKSYGAVIMLGYNIVLDRDTLSDYYNGLHTYRLGLEAMKKVPGMENRANSLLTRVTEINNKFNLFYNFSDISIPYSTGELNYPERGLVDVIGRFALNSEDRAVRKNAVMWLSKLRKSSPFTMRGYKAYKYLSEVQKKDKDDSITDMAAMGQSSYWAYGY